MASAFRVVTTPAFEREFRKGSRGNVSLIGALEELAVILAEDPHNRSGQHQIKKLEVALLTSLRAARGLKRYRL
jgi:hypothetical protein